MEGVATKLLYRATLILLNTAIRWQSLLQSSPKWSSKESFWSIVTPKSFVSSLV